MMKVLILSVSDKRHMPMIAPYIDYLENSQISYDVIRSNRYETRNEFLTIEKHNLGCIYEINIVFNQAIKKWKKITPFIRFKLEAERIMRRENYSYVIVWNENTAALFSDVLAFHYHGRYCVNLRDIYQQNFGISKLVNIAIKYSHFITVPSPEFETGYQDKTFCIFNRDTRLLKHWKQRNSFREKGKPIRVTHLGFYSKVKKAADDLADLFGNDKRFELHFYGNGFDTQYRNLIMEKGYTNIFTGGAFPYEDTVKFLLKTDIINSYYSTLHAHPSLKLSFGIKHSYTPLLCLPGLANEDTCWGRMSKPFGLAYLVNDDNFDSLPDDLYKWYNNLDFSRFCKECEKFNSIIDESQKILVDKLDEALRRA